MEVNAEITSHLGQRDVLAAYFRAQPDKVVRWQTLVDLVGLNYMQRLSNARTQLQMDIECIPRWKIVRDAAGKAIVRRATGDYRFKPASLGRSADVQITAQPRLPLYDGPAGAYQR